MDRLWDVLARAAPVVAAVAAVAGAVFVYVAVTRDDTDEPEPSTRLADAATVLERAPVNRSDAATRPRQLSVADSTREPSVEAPPVETNPIQGFVQATMEPLTEFAESLSPQQQATLILLCLTIVIVYIIAVILNAIGVEPLGTLAPVGWAAAGSLATFALASGALPTAGPRGERAPMVHGAGNARSGALRGFSAVKGISEGDAAERFEIRNDEQAVRRTDSVPTFAPPSAEAVADGNALQPALSAGAAVASESASAALSSTSTDTVPSTPSTILEELHEYIRAVDAFQVRLPFEAGFK
jgi:hypothetical protein